MISADKIKEQYKRNLQVGNYAEARHEWQWLSDIPGQSFEPNVVDEAPRMLLSMEYHIGNKNLPETVRVNEWFDNHIPDYEREGRAQLFARIIEPRRILSELTLAESGLDEDAYNAALTRLTQLGWGTSELEDRAMLLAYRLRTKHALACLKSGKRIEHLNPLLDHAKNLNSSKYPTRQDEIEKFRRKLIDALSQTRKADLVELIHKAIAGEKFDEASKLLAEGREDFEEDPAFDRLWERISVDAAKYQSKTEEAERLEKDARFEEAFGTVSEALELFPECIPGKKFANRIEVKLAQKTRYDDYMARGVYKYNDLRRQKEFRLAFKHARDLLATVKSLESGQLLSPWDYSVQLQEAQGRVKEAIRRMIWAWIRFEAAYIAFLKKLGIR